MNAAPISAAEGHPERRWPWRLAVAFVLFTLVALVTIPWLVQRRVENLRQNIEASEPARTLVMRWQFNLIREMSALSELLLTGDTAETAAFRTARSVEESIYRELAPLVAEMGPEVMEPFAAARALSVQWHTRVSEGQVPRVEEGVGLLENSRERRLFEEVMTTVAAVDSAIVRVRTRERQAIQSAEQAGLSLTVILGLLALLAATTVVALDARVRSFATETERRREEAAEALEARARIMRGITHDVKNPLGAAKGYADLLAMGVKAPVAPEQTPLVEGIQRSVDSALAIIADLLDFARLDSGGMAVNRLEVDLNELVREAVEDFRPAAESAGHDIEAETGGGPLVAYTDPARVRQVLDNLVSNAIKYTPASGRIVVRARNPEDGAPRGGAWAALEVSDTGPGIPPEQRESVFEEFTRLEEGSTTKGHGLGLAIARGLSRHLGGDLTIADSDVGATFVLWIPQREITASDEG